MIRKIKLRMRSHGKIDFCQSTSNFLGRVILFFFGHGNLRNNPEIEKMEKHLEWGDTFPASKRKLDFYSFWQDLGFGGCFLSVKFYIIEKVLKN